MFNLVRTIVNAMKIKNYLPHIALLQTFAFLCVVLGHALSLYCAGGWYNHWHFVPSLDSLNSFIYAFHMPLFFFISGFLLFITTKGDFSWTAYNKKRLKRLVIPYYLAGIFYFLPTIALTQPFKQPWSLTAKLYLTLQDGGYLWFLISLFLTSLVFTTLIKTPLKNKPLYLFIIVLACNLLSTNFGLPDMLTKKVLTNLLYFYAGYYIASRPNIEKFISRPLYIAVIFTISFTCFMANFKSAVALGLIIAFYGLSTWVCAKLPVLGTNKIVKFIASNMILLYIFHEPIMIAMLKSWNYASTMNPYFASAMLFVLDLLLTLNVTYLWQLITKKK